MVIAIIGILAAIILPALARAKEEGRAIVCLNNVKQFGCAWQLYCRDHDDQVPPNTGGTYGFPEGPSWLYGLLEPRRNWADNTNLALLQQSLLGPYLGTSLGVWRCPDDTSVAQEGGQWYPRTRTYSMNAWLNGVPRPLTRMTQLTQPTETFLFLDEREDSIESCAFSIDPGNGPASLAALPGSYHNGCASIVFADGHAERHKWIDARTNPPLIRGGFVGIPWMPKPPNPDVTWLRMHANF